MWAETVTCGAASSISGAEVHVFVWHAELAETRLGPRETTLQPHSKACQLSTGQLSSTEAIACVGGAGAAVASSCAAAGAAASFAAAAASGAASAGAAAAVTSTEAAGFSASPLLAAAASFFFFSASCEGGRVRA